eukprot:m.123124 g.123124  ORF g.123124 m.123124 type:complete len:73 (+) comp16582_c0_seq6:1284-1502(+)
MVVAMHETRLLSFPFAFLWLGSCLRVRQPPLSAQFLLLSRSFRDTVLFSRKSYSGVAFWAFVLSAWELDIFC